MDNLEASVNPPYMFFGMGGGGEKIGLPRRNPSKHRENIKLHTEMSGPGFQLMTSEL